MKEKEIVLNVPKDSTSIKITVNGKHYPLILEFDGDDNMRHYFLAGLAYDGYDHTCKE